MQKQIKSIHVSRVHNRLNFSISLNPDINIIHAENGAGKTTFLHIIANIMNSKFERFTHLDFDEIDVELFDGTQITVSKNDSSPHNQQLTVKINNEIIWKISPTELSPDDIINNEFLRLIETTQTISALENGIPTRRYSFSAKRLNAIAKTSYFPAFRTMIEAWSSAPERTKRSGDNIGQILVELEEQGLTGKDAVVRAQSTLEARRIFGDFVPTVNYPSPSEIANSINDEIQRNIVEIGNYDSKLLSDFFVEVLKALSTDTDQGSSKTNDDDLMREIESLLDDRQVKTPKGLSVRNILELPQSSVYDRLRTAFEEFRSVNQPTRVPSRILTVYRDSLQNRAKKQQEAFSTIELFLSAVNEFLTRKSLSISSDNREYPQVVIKFPDGKLVSKLNVLSSGERQLLTLLYASTKMAQSDIVLVDEPEISLHIDWQRQLLRKMVEQMGQRQIIVCTHSPSFGAEYFDKMIALVPLSRSIRRLR